MVEEKELSTFQQAVKLTDHERRLKEVEDDMKSIKPIVYNTASSVKQIEKSVEKISANSDKMRGYFLAATITGAVGLVFVAIRSWLGV